MPSRERIRISVTLSMSVKTTAIAEFNAPDAVEYAEAIANVDSDAIDRH